MSIQNSQLNKCENCYYFGEIPDDKISGYCMKDALLTCKTDICPSYREKEKGKERNNKSMPKEILLCDNCRFADYKDNNDNFYCSLYDQQFFADPKHLVCEHHSYYCKGFDSPRYVK